MKKLSILLLLFCLLAPCSGRAQKENNNWAMGYRLGLEFNSGAPLLTSSGIDTWEGCAAVSDAAGNLLFYADAGHVYDRTHAVMPNGAGLLGSTTTTQGVAIAAVKGSPDKYYLFTIGDAPVGKLHYSIVDMSLNGGLGDIDITQKNQFLLARVGEKMCIAGNCTNQWLVTHSVDSPWFYAYNLDAFSASSVPVLSAVGPSRGSGYCYGEMKVSPASDRLALAEYMSCVVDFFDFDISSGRVSNQASLDSFAFPHVIYGIEFSPDGSKFYAGSGNLPVFYQYDLSLGSIAAAKASRVSVITGKTVWGMRRGPDNKIYIIEDTRPTNFSRIRSPNLAGALCDYDPAFLGTSLPGGAYCLGYGNAFMPRGLADTVNTLTEVKICIYDSVTVSAAAGRNDYRWQDGDTARSRKFFGTGIYWVRSSGGCSLYTDSFRLVPKGLDTTAVLAKDTLICDGSTLDIAAPKGRDFYKWSDGSTDTLKTLSAPSKVYLVSRKGCDLFIDTFRIRGSLPDTIRNPVTDTAVCTGRTLLWRLSGMDHYEWGDGDTASFKPFHAPAVFTLRSFKDCSLYLDTFRVRERSFRNEDQDLVKNVCFAPSAVISAPAGYHVYLWSSGNTGPDTLIYSAADIALAATDTINCRILQQRISVRFTDFESHIPDAGLCNEDTLLLDATISVPGARYRWSNNDTSAVTRVKNAGTLFVHITVNDCTLTDTVQVVSRSLAVYIGEDQFVCKGSTITLNAGLADADYHWSTGATTRELQVTTEGLYVLTVEKDGCSTKDEAYISFVNCDHCVAFPNAFSPNNDGINDFFKPLLNCPPKTYDFSIYNRWGQKIYHTLSPVDSWNGMEQGGRIDGNVFFYMLRISFLGQDTEPRLFKGEVILIR